MKLSPKKIIIIKINKRKIYEKIHYLRHLRNLWFHHC